MNKYTDSHGNIVELDDAVKAYTTKKGKLVRSPRIGIVIKIMPKTVDIDWGGVIINRKHSETVKLMKWSREES